MGKNKSNPGQDLNLDPENSGNAGQDIENNNANQLSKDESVDSDLPIGEYVEVKFLKSPTGAYNLAYNAGDVGSVEKELAEKLIESGFAQAV